VIYAARQADRDEPRSTNLDLWWAPVDGSAPRNLTAANHGTDTTPAVSPDGRWLAWAAMARPGYEADRLVVQLMDLKTGKSRALTQDWDRSASSLAFTPDSKALIVTAEDVLDTPAFRVDLASGQATRLSSRRAAKAMSAQIIPLKGGAFLLKRDAVDAAPELYLGKPQANLAGQRLTDLDASAGKAWRRSRSSGSRSPGPMAIPSGARSSSRPAPPASCRPCCWSMAGRRARSTIAGPPAGTRASGRRRAMPRSPSISTARPATARPSPTASTRIGAASRCRTCNSAWCRRGQGWRRRSLQRLRRRGSYGGYMMNWIEGSGPMRSSASSSTMACSMPAPWPMKPTSCGSTNGNMAATPISRRPKPLKSGTR
jgi:hypothetical protein